MNRSVKKFVAVIMLLWLPVFTGSALAASVSMQLPQGGCHEAAMSQEAMNMDMNMNLNMNMDMTMKMAEAPGPMKQNIF